MELDERELEAACREVVSHTLWQTARPRTVDDIVDQDQIANTVSAYMKIAKEMAEYLVEVGDDPNAISRAIQYLARQHAIPPMKEDLSWFRQSLLILIDLVSPNTGATETSVKFMDDVERGVRLYRESLRESEG